MALRILSIFFIFYFISCTTLPRGYKLAQFSVNEKKYNHLIINRVPDYGDGHSDGCIIMNEMSLKLFNTHDKLISGFINDIYSEKRLKNANIQIYYTYQNDPVIISSDSSGNFVFLKNEKIYSVNILSLGYRSLNIKLEGKKILN